MNLAQPLGHRDLLIAEREAILANVSAAHRRRIVGDRKPLDAPQPIFHATVYLRGRYIPKPLSDIIELAAEVGGMQFMDICNRGRKREIAHARSAVSNLAEEFVRSLSAQSVDAALNQGDGLCAWYRERHRDRLEAYEDYLVLHETCRAVLLRKGAP